MISKGKCIHVLYNVKEPQILNTKTHFLRRKYEQRDFKFLNKWYGMLVLIKRKMRSDAGNLQKI